MKLLIALFVGLGMLSVLSSTATEIARTFTRDGLFSGLIHLGSVLAFIETTIRLAKK